MEGSTKMEATETDDKRLEDVQPEEIGSGGEETKNHSENNKEEEDGPEETWDLIEVLQGDHGLKCRMEGCEEKAIAVWKSNLADDSDTW